MSGQPLLMLARTPVNQTSLIRASPSDDRTGSDERCASLSSDSACRAQSTLGESARGCGRDRPHSPARSRCEALRRERLNASTVSNRPRNLMATSSRPFPRRFPLPHPLPPAPSRSGVAGWCDTRRGWRRGMKRVTQTVGRLLFHGTVSRRSTRRPGHHIALHLPVRPALSSILAGNNPAMRSGPPGGAVKEPRRKRRCRSRRRAANSSTGIG